MSDIQVGTRCTIERRFGRGLVDHRWEATVVRLTSKRAYFDRSWFALDDPLREVRPKYLDYTTVVAEVLPAEPHKGSADE